MKKSLLVTAIILALNYLFYMYSVDQAILGGTYFQKELRSSLYKILVYGGPVLIFFHVLGGKTKKVAIKGLFGWFREQWVYVVRILWACILLLGKQVGNIEFGVYGLFYVLIINSLVEESVFRGYIQEQLIHQYGVMKGIIQQSILFGLVHLPFYHSHYQDGLYVKINTILGGYLPLELGPYIIFMMIGTPIVLGLLRGWTTYKTKSLWTSIVRHSIHNGILLFL